MKRIFISSTFIDMQAERDLLCTKVTSKLNQNETVKKHGEYVSFCDLRWGVNTNDIETEDTTQKVLKVCLDEIDRCDKTGSLPYIVVLIGNRYGSRPEKAMLDSIGNRQNRNYTVNKDTCSITALEIEYGALRDRGHLDRTLFYFREIKDTLSEDSKFAVDGETKDDKEANKEALEKLKKKIISAGGNVKNYSVSLSEDKEHITGLEEKDGFCDMIAKDIAALIERDLGSSEGLSEHEMLSRAQRNIAMQKARQFGARQNVANSLIRKLSQTSDVLAVTGKTGSGKSTLVSRMAQMLFHQKKDVIPVFCGSNLALNDAVDVLSYIVYSLEDRMGVPHIRAEGEANTNAKPVTQDDLRGRLAWLASQYNENEVYVLIDGVDQLFDDESREKLVFLPESSTKKIKFLFSCTDDMPVPKENIHKVTLGDLSYDEVYPAIDSILQHHGRELEKSVKVAIANKEEARNPLYLSLLVQRLLMMDQSDFAAIKEEGDTDSVRLQYKVGLINSCSDTVEALCNEIITEAAIRIGCEHASKAVEYIALTQSGLRENDLEKLLPGQWNSLDFSLLIHYLPGFFMTRDDGRYDFTHKSIRKGIIEGCEDAKTKHKELRAHMHTLAWDDPLSLSETVYQCYKADDKEYFVWYITDIVKDDYYTAIRPAAKTFFEIIAKEGDGWLTDLIANGDISLTRHFYKFLYRFLRDHFLKNGTNVKSFNRILHSALHRFSADCDFSVTDDMQAIAEFNSYLGMSFEALGDYLSAELYLKESVRIFESIPARGEACEDAMQSAYNRYGLVLSGMGRVEESLACYKRCIELCERIGTDRLSLSVYYHNVADYYLDIGDLANAAKYEEQALLIVEKLAKDDPDAYAESLILYYRKIAVIYKQQGKNEKAKMYIDKALALAIEYTAKNPEEYETELGYVYNDKGYVYSGEDYSGQVAACYEKALKIFRKYALAFAEKYEEMLATVLHNLAGEYKKSSDFQNLSEKAYLECIGIKEKRYAVNPRGMAMSLAVSYNNLGALYHAQSAWADARQYYLKAIATAPKSPMKELYGRRKELAVFYQNAGEIFNKLFMPIKAGRYMRISKRIEACESYEKFEILYEKKLKKYETLFVLKKDSASHLFLKLNLLSVFLVIYLLTNAENDSMRAILIYAIGIFGVFTINVMDREIKFSKIERIFYYITLIGSVNIIPGVCLLFRTVRYRRKRNIPLQPKTVKIRPSVECGEMSIQKLGSKITKLKKRNERLEMALQIVRTEEYRENRRKLLKSGINFGFVSILFFLFFLLPLTIMAQGVLIPFLYCLLIIANVRVASKNLKNVWFLDVKKRTLLIVISIASLGTLSGIFSYFLFRKETNVQLNLVLVKIILIFFNPVLILYMLLSKKKAANRKDAAFENPMETELYLNTEKINRYQLELAKLQYDRNN